MGRAARDDPDARARLKKREAVARGNKHAAGTRRNLKAEVGRAMRAAGLGASVVSSFDLECLTCCKCGEAIRSKNQVSMAVEVNGKPGIVCTNAVCFVEAGGKGRPEGKTIGTEVRSRRKGVPRAARAHSLIVAEGRRPWNDYREKHGIVRPELQGCIFAGKDLHKINFSGANLRKATLKHGDFTTSDFSRADLAGVSASDADFSNADFTQADLSDADLSGTKLVGTCFAGANLSRCNLGFANLTGANLTGAKLTGANLSSALVCGCTATGVDMRQADLRLANLLETDFAGADFSGSMVYGSSVWAVNLEGSVQADLLITQPGDSAIVVDNLELAQLVFLICNSSKVRELVDTLATKTVLILGSFSYDRMPVLNHLREGLRSMGLVPLLFDFEPPVRRNLSETVSALAHLSRFIIADVSDPRSVPAELASLIPQLPSVPVQPIIAEGQEPFALLDSLAAYPWVRPLLRYDELGEQNHSLLEEIVLHIDRDDVV